MKDTVRPPSPPLWFANNAYLLLTMTSLFWASNLILARFVAGHVPPIAMSCIRWAAVSLLLLPLAWPHLKRDWPNIRGDIPLIIVLAATGFALNGALTYYAMQYTTALNALLIQSAGPLFVALWSFLVLRMALTAAQGFGIAISLVGVLVIVLQGSFTVLRSITFSFGDLMIVVTTFTFGLYSALLTRRRKMHALSFLVVVATCGAILMVPFAVIEAAAGARLSFNAETVGAIVYSGLFPSAIAFLCFNRGVELVGPNRAAPFIHLVPVFGSLMAILLLGERLMLYHAAGYLLVLLGVVIAARK
jgi:drug/metabolite transporter (DMT)-like permease